MMKMKYILLLGFTLLVCGPIMAQAPASADVILNTAKATAARENKKVMIIFHASWCGWCHKMDTSLNDASVKKYFDNNYVIEHLTVLESDSKKAMENPGAAAMMKQYKGDEGGIPFWLVFDQNGILLADSKIKGPNDPLGAGDNAGCPASEKEVDYFISVLRKTSKITDKEAEQVKTVFRKNE